MQKRLGRHTVVLLGVGHTNAHVLRMWKMDPPKNAQLICVSDFPVVTYSGMLPGVISGQYPQDAMEIDLIRLAQSTGARVVIANVIGLDHEKRELVFDSRPPLSFDVLSIGIGSRPSFSDVIVAKDAPLLAIKPMQTFLNRLADRLARLKQAGVKSPKIIVVGGGVGSIEVAFCLNERFYGGSRHRISNWPDDLKPEISIVTGSDVVGRGLLDSTVNRIDREFKNRGITKQVNSRVISVDSIGLNLKCGRSITADVILWATNAVASPLLGQLGLDTDERGFLLTKPDLEVTRLPGVFAVGDTGTIVGSNTSKAGVYAVRQGPVLLENILNKLENKKTLRDYQPQSDFLKLINLGNDQAIAEYKGFSFSNRFCWKFKDHIDAKFMRMYQSYEPMAMSSAADDEEPMRCLGCGGKIGSQILSNVLSELQVIDHPDVKIGLAHPDDAAIVTAHNNEVTVTTDFFAAPFDDPYLVGRVAALNSASDCFVMGAKPTSALAIVQIPLGHPRAQAQVMREIMAGSVEELNRMEAAIVGGHSIEGPRMMVGFTVLGKQLVEPTTKSMLKEGDQLILTKPIGTGVLLAAWMQSLMPANCYLPLVESMLKSNEIALELSIKFPVSALTDVTGFGLIGHLSELMKASGVSATIQKNQVPILPGGLSLIDQGIQSTLAPDNRSLSGRIELKNGGPDSPELAAMFDPQTGGGLLFGIAEPSVSDVLAFLSEAGFDQSVVIGQVAAANGDSLELYID